jgi:hypothetical protein
MRREKKGKEKKRKGEGRKGHMGKSDLYRAFSPIGTNVSSHL